MKKLIKDKKGFTLLEMLMVMFVIAILLLLVIPNITKHKETVNDKGCESYASVVQTQVSAFELAEGRLPSSLEELARYGYIPSVACSDGTQLVLVGSEVRVQE